MLCGCKFTCLSRLINHTFQTNRQHDALTSCEALQNHQFMVDDVLQIRKMVKHVVKLTFSFSYKHVP